jgi:hypothetical protein
VPSGKIEFSADVGQAAPDKRVHAIARERRPLPNMPLSLKVKFILVFD